MFARLKSFLRSALDRLDAFVVRWAVGSRVSTSLYVASIGRFSREHRAVVRGRVKHLASTQGAHDPRLRRAIHRLEKGLVMRPRSASFAADYIGETVAVFDRALRSVDHDAAELCWASAVLHEYFSVVTDTPPIAAARAQFHSLRAPNAAPRSAPFAREAIQTSGVGFDAFLALCRQRRSVRWFLPEAVPRALVERALEAALQAPSACNRQPFSFRFFEAPVAGRIASIAMGTTGYAQQIPALLVLVGDWSNFQHERDRHLPYIDGALAAMQLMLALETLGLGSCPINWPDVEALERRMERELALPPWMRPVMLIALGYPDPTGGIAFSAKKPVDSVLR